MVESACIAGDPGSISGSGRSPGEGNGNPPQHSCLENPMDRGAWWATDYGVAKSWTWLSAEHRTSQWHLQRLFPDKFTFWASFARNTIEPVTLGNWHFPTLLLFTTGIFSLNWKVIKFCQALKWRNAPFQPRGTPYINGNIQSKPGLDWDFQLPPRGREFGVTVKHLFNIGFSQTDACLWHFSSRKFLINIKGDNC